MSMSEQEYATKKRQLDAMLEKLETEKETVRKEGLRLSFVNALQAAGMDSSWAAIIAPESEADIPRLVQELKARGVGGSISAEGTGARLGKIESEQKAAVAAANFFRKTGK